MLIHHNKQSGFTLLEMIVSLGIFTVVAVFAVGSLVRITALNRQAQTLQKTITNVSFALEMMSREMRMGSDFYCGSSPPPTVLSQSNLACPLGLLNRTTRYIAFQSTNVDTSCSNSSISPRLVYAYEFTSSGIFKEQQSSCGGQFSTPSPILDSDITLTNYELGASTPSGGYTWIFIRLMGQAGVRAQDVNTFDIQTGISQRIAD